MLVFSWSCHLIWDPTCVTGRRIAVCRDLANVLRGGEHQIFLAGWIWKEIVNPMGNRKSWLVSKICVERGDRGRGGGTKGDLLPSEPFYLAVDFFYSLAELLRKVRSFPSRINHVLARVNSTVNLIDGMIRLKELMGFRCRPSCCGESNEEQHTFFHSNIACLT